MMREIAFKKVDQHFIKFCVLKTLTCVTSVFYGQDYNKSFTSILSIYTSESCHIKGRLCSAHVVNPYIC